jgi:hypothetical protein
LKNIIDLTDKLTNDSSDESEIFILSDYSIKEPDSKKSECIKRKNFNVKTQKNSNSNSNSEYIILNNYSIKDI